MPNLSDLDFPVLSYLLSVSRYMLLENKTNSFEETNLIKTYNLHRDVSISDGKFIILISLTWTLTKIHVIVMK